MNNWEMRKLGEVCSKIGSGATPRGGKESYKESGISFIRSQNVLDFAFSNEGLVFIDDSQAQQLENVTVQKGDVLINITGDSVARTCMAPEEHLPARVNQHVSIVRTDPQVADPHFVHYFLQHQKVHLLSIGSSGGTRNALTKRMLEELVLPLPDITTQRDISATLSRLDNKIIQNTKINHHLEQMAQAIFKSWFVDFEPFWGVMPDGWREGSIRDTCSAIYNGGTPRRNETHFWNGGIPWLTSGEVRQAIIVRTENFISESGLSGSSAKWVPSLATVVALYGATAGQVSMVASPLTTNQAVCALIPKETSAFYNYLCMRSAVRELENQAIGSAQQNISKGIVERTPCLIPDRKALAEFDSLVSPLFTAWITNLEQSARLSTLRDTLLPRLMSGELSVSDLGDAK